MQFRAPAIVCAVRPHGETGAVVRLLTEAHGLVASYVAGARGRQLRPVLIPGNLVDAELRSRSETMLPFARVELLQSRGPWLTEPLPAAAIGWATALTAAALAERQPHPALFQALSGLLDAVCHAPSARGWVPALVGYEVLLLRDLGYGAEIDRPDAADWDGALRTFDRLAHAFTRHIFGDRPLAPRRGDVMAARAMLRERLARIEN